MSFILMENLILKLLEEEKSKVFNWKLDLKMNDYLFILMNEIRDKLAKKINYIII